LAPPMCFGRAVFSDYGVTAADNLLDLALHAPRR